ncbi:MAG TPA: hypothetical protein VFM18_01915, partial [Methanosarcina sp.]|nr:hypothetical protein [Methanosarcina sp.]
GKVYGAKLFMVLLNSLIVIVAWRISSLFSDNLRHRFFSIAALVIGLPMVPASNQIYPDLLAGLIALLGIYWILTVNKTRPPIVEIMFSLAIAYLPWLQIKNFSAALIIVTILSLQFFGARKYTRAAIILTPFLILQIILGCYNFYAFGKISGPYHDGSLEISKTAIMVLIGLLIDQNQGFMLQNPMFFAGMVGIGLLCQINWRLTAGWLIIFLSFLLPNAMHPNWYGGYSFSGRFGWSGAIVFFVPTLLGLLKLASNRSRLFYPFIFAGFLLQLYFYVKYSIWYEPLYNRIDSSFIQSYTIFYFPIQGWMPALFNSNWAASYLPNYAFLLLLIMLLLVGFKRGNGGQRNSIFLFGSLAVSVTAIVAAGFLPDSHDKLNFPIIFQSTQLPSQTGSKEAGLRVARQGIDKAGYVNFGPYILLEKATIN